MRFGKTITTFFNMTGGLAYERVMLPALQSGDIGGLRKFLRERAHLGRLSIEVADGIRDIISDPADYKNSAASLKILFRHSVEIAPIFSALEKEEGREDLEKRLWHSYAVSPSEDAAEGIAMIMAEYIRYRMGTDSEGYQLNLNQLLPQMDTEISNVIRERTLEAVKIVQHKLVEYVSKEGGELPLNRGAGLLSVGQDLPGSELWMKKIEDFSVRTRESLTAGTVRDYSPVFPS